MNYSMLCYINGLIEFFNADVFVFVNVAHKILKLLNRRVFLEVGLCGVLCCMFWDELIGTLEICDVR